MKPVFIIFLFGLISINSSAINPSREYLETPEKIGLKYSEYQLKTKDNFLINVWEYAVPDSLKSDKTIIFVGTDAGNMSQSIWVAKAFIEKGFRVISFDYRGFGKSTDFAINKDLLFHPEFAIDLDTVIKNTQEKYSNDKVGLFALSMGTYVSLIRKEKIDFLVAEGFYNNPYRVVHRIKLNKNEDVLLPAKTKTVSKLKPHVPSIIFCASDDMITTTDEAKAFRKNNKVMIEEFNGKHLWGLSVLSKNNLGDEYIEKITNFLKLNNL